MTSSMRQIPHFICTTFNLRDSIHSHLASSPFSTLRLRSAQLSMLSATIALYPPQVKNSIFTSPPFAKVPHKHQYIFDQPASYPHHLAMRANNNLRIHNVHAFGLAEPVISCLAPHCIRRSYNRSGRSSHMRSQHPELMLEPEEPQVVRADPSSPHEPLPSDLTKQ
jgi:hypothetical protein